MICQMIAGRSEQQSGGPMNRRQFLQIAAASGAGAALTAASGLGDDKAAAEKLFLSAPLTHSDWMLKPGIQWGAEGVRHMLDACKACGWSRIHWRVLDGGRATYPSKVVRPSFKVDSDTSIWNPKTEAEKALYKTFFGNVAEARRLQI